MSLPKLTSQNAWEKMAQSPSTDMFFENVTVDSTNKNHKLQVLMCLCGWYTTSISLHLYNKWLFSKDYYNFPFPLFSAALQMLMHFAMSSIILVYFLPSVTPHARPMKSDFWKRLLPCGLTTGLDIGLSNSSLKVVSVSFYTMIKSSAPVFVVLFAFLFKLEEPSYRMFLIIGIICVGVLLMVSAESQEVHFNLPGYLQVQFAAIFSGLRWTLTNILLLRKSMGMHHPLVTSYYLAPIVSICVFIGFLIAEGPVNLLNSIAFKSPLLFLNIMGILGVGGCLAFALSLIEFQLISITSVVTFTVAGIFKEIITIVLAQWIYKDKISALEVLGLIISIVGIALYNYFKVYKSTSPTRNGSIPLQNLNNAYKDVEFEIDDE